MKYGNIFGKKKHGVKIINCMDKRPALMISTVSFQNKSASSAGKKNRKGEYWYKGTNTA